MKAIANVAAYSGVDLSRIFPECPLLPIDPEHETRNTTTLDNEAMAYVSTNETGQSRWDCPSLQSQAHVRLVLCPDEGGPLWSAYQFLAHNNAAIGFRRDELYLSRMFSNLSVQVNV